MLIYIFINTEFDYEITNKYSCIGVIVLVKLVYKYKTNGVI